MPVDDGSMDNDRFMILSLRRFGFDVEAAGVKVRLRVRAWEEIELRPRPPPLSDERRREELRGTSVDRDGRDSNSISSLDDIVRTGSIGKMTKRDKS